MYYVLLLRHQLEKRKRSKGLSITIIMHLLLGLWILSCAIFIAFIAQKQLPLNYRSHLLNKVMVPYIITDLLLRYFFGTTSTVNIYPYLSINIPKKALVNFATFFSYATKFNLLSICLLVGLRYVNGQTFSGIFLPGALSLVLIINSLTFLIKQISYRYTFLHLVYPILLGSLLSFFMSPGSPTSFENNLTNTIFFSMPGTLLLVLIFLFLLFIQRKFIEHSFYEIYQKQTGTGLFSFKLKFSSNEILNWIILEFKLIARNSKPRRIIISGFFTSLYWIYFKYGNSKLGDLTFLLFIVAISTLVSFGYGIFSFSWNWKHIDFIMTKPADPKAMLSAKWIIIVLMEILMLVPPIILFIDDLIFMKKLSYCAIYIVGIPPFITLYSSIFFSKKIDLGLPGYSANYEGRSFKHIIPELIFILFPVIIFLILKVFNHLELTYEIIAAVGIAGLLSTNYLFNVALKEATKRRYSLILKFKN